MIGDYNFWEDILKNYISSVATGITLLLVGTIGYFSNKKWEIVAKIIKSNTKNQDNKRSGGGNIQAENIEKLIINYQQEETDLDISDSSGTFITIPKEDYYNNEEEL